MLLQPGVRLGPYEIIALVDAGGMGEVYRARDTRLRRDVAVKVLAGYDAASPERLQRFDREARAAAALNHPNILALYDVGNEGGVPFIVSELLDGGTLRDALGAGRVLSVARVVAIATQIARALAAAHARGIVHRDLKPENVFLCRDGTVKLLDFGLARLNEAASDPSPDTTVSLTAENAVVGTAGYMAPEQVRGQEIDHRADVFSFGVVVYELLTGQRAFTGDSGADVMTAILTKDPPDLLECAPAAPSALARIVSRCLDKRRDGRFQSTSDLAFALEALSTTSGAAIAPPPARRPLLPTLVKAAAAALAVITATGFAVWGSRDTTSWPSRALRVQRMTDFEGVEEFPALSPDGKSVAFTAGVDGLRQVFVRLVAGGTPLQLTAAGADHQYPRWTPDSSSLIYFAPAASAEAQGALWQVSALGGAPRRVAPSLGGGDVGADGRIAFFRLAGQHVELVAAPLEGSGVRVIRQFTPGSYYWYPRWSPDGRWVAYQKGDGVRFDVFVVPADGGEPRAVTNDSALLAGFAWRPDSQRLIYSTSRDSSIPYLPLLSLWEARLDGGAPRAVLGDEVSYMHPDLHASGAVVVSRMLRRTDVWKFAARQRAADANEAPVQVTHQTGHVHTPTASPDGAELAFMSDSGGHSNLWVLTLQSGAMRQLTHERETAIAMGVPVWSPDGRTIAFVSSRGNPGLVFGIWLVNPDGGNLRNVAPRGLGPTWSPDGRWVYFVERANEIVRKVSVDGGASVVVRSEPARNVIGIHGSTLYFLVERALVDGSPEFEIRAATPEDGPSRVVARLPASRLASWQVVNPALSPDGKWLAQALTDGLTTNVWIASTDTGEWQRITDFGHRATYIARRVSWSADGRHVFAAVSEGDADIIRIER